MYQKQGGNFTEFIVFKNSLNDNFSHIFSEMDFKENRCEADVKEDTSPPPSTLISIILPSSLVEHISGMP